LPMERRVCGLPIKTAASKQNNYPPPDLPETQ
jgi:hypothetical protein